MKRVRRLLFTLIIIGCLLYMSIAVIIAFGVDDDTKVKSDTIIVLGARAKMDNKVNPCLKARVDQGVQLYKNKYAKTIILSGGGDIEDQVNEAEEMKKITQAQKVPERSILLEKESTSTYENLLFSKRIMEKNKLQSAIIVTEPFHQPRAQLVAKKLGLNITTSPAADSPCWTRWKLLSRYFLKEPVIIFAYYLQGKL